MAQIGQEQTYQIHAALSIAMGGSQMILRTKSGVKKTLIYTYLGIMLVSLFGAGSLPSSYQKPVVSIGLVLTGLLLVAAVPIVWHSKTPLRGRWMHIEFSRHPLVYAIWLIFGLICGRAIISFLLTSRFGTCSASKSFPSYLTSKARLSL